MEHSVRFGNEEFMLMFEVNDRDPVILTLYYSRVYIAVFVFILHYTVYLGLSKADSPNSVLLPLLFNSMR